ncbi:hypothetical protein B9Z19DRAFT_1196291 [Tuber borchii]|uniref:Uncharacterized protein n=1 Tax=Tuber borchii TaxID=42251 RepID=A0A2T6ZFS8_TUBBO|nr:hypothetical protein B9Z19DRAFT_1196291 [Tuber borchii]
MAHIKKEQSVDLTYPQRELQIGVQAPHNTITQSVRAGKAPALNSEDSIMRVLKDTAEGVAKVVQGQATILRKLEALQDRQDAMLQELPIIQQEQAPLIQTVGRLEEGMRRLEHRLDAIHPEVRGIRPDSPHHEQNRIARLINRRAKRDNTVLEPFYGFNGQLIPDFPRTLGDTKRLNSLDLTILLLYLGLPASGSFAVRKARFLNYVGLVYLG